MSDRNEIYFEFNCVIHRHRFTTMARYGQRNSTAAAVGKTLRNVW